VKDTHHKANDNTFTKLASRIELIVGQINVFDHLCVSKYDEFNGSNMLICFKKYLIIINVGKYRSLFPPQNKKICYCDFLTIQTFFSHIVSLHKVAIVSYKARIA